MAIIFIAKGFVPSIKGEVERTTDGGAHAILVTGSVPWSCSTNRVSSSLNVFGFDTLTAEAAVLMPIPI